MERVSFEVAKALKEAGYPQSQFAPQYKENGEFENGLTDLGEGCYYAPTYTDVWLWLWREKGVKIDIMSRYYAMAIIEDSSFCENDPEKAIIAAIKYLVNENLLK